MLGPLGFHPGTLNSGLSPTAQKSGLMGGVICDLRTLHLDSGTGSAKARGHEGSVRG